MTYINLYSNLNAIANLFIGFHNNNNSAVFLVLFVYIAARERSTRKKTKEKTKGREGLMIKIRLEPHAPFCKCCNFLMLLDAKLTKATKLPNASPQQQQQAIFLFVLYKCP